MIRRSSGAPCVSRGTAEDSEDATHQRYCGYDKTCDEASVPIDELHLVSPGRDLYSLERIIGAPQAGGLSVHRCLPARVKGLGGDHQARLVGLDLQRRAVRRELPGNNSRLSSIAHGDERPGFHRQIDDLARVESRIQQNVRRRGVINENGLLSGGEQWHIIRAGLPIEKFSRSSYLRNSQKIRQSCDIICRYV